MDNKNKVLKVEDISLPVLPSKDPDAVVACYRVVALEDTCFEPKTESIVPARLVGYSKGRSFCIIELTDRQIIPGKLVGKTLANLYEDVPVRIVNVSGDKRKV